MLTPQEIAQGPDRITSHLALDANEPVVFRVLRREDAGILGRYFIGLSEATRRCFGPHPFTLEQAQKLCHELDYAKVLRLIVVKGEGEEAEVIAYFILYLGIQDAERRRYAEHGIALDDATDCTFAPSVADAYQNRGLGSACMPLIVDIARQLGFKRMVLSGGTQTANQRAIHFYEKHGFRKLWEFKTQVGNQDMLLDIV